MAILTGARLIAEKAGVVAAIPKEIGGGCAHRRIIKVVVCGHRIGLAIGVTVDEQALRGGIHNVVLEDVVGGVVLHLELTAAGVFGVVAVKGVVDDGAILGAADVASIAADGDAHGVGRIHDVVANRHSGAVVAAVFAGDFDIEIVLIAEVALDDDAGTTVAVDTVRVVLIPFARIVDGGDVIDGVAADFAVAGVIVGGVRGDTLEADGIDADIVVVVDEVVGDDEIGDIAIDVDGLAVAGFVVVNGVAADGDVADGGRGFRPYTAIPKALPFFSDEVVMLVTVLIEDVDVAAGTGDPDAGGSRVGAGGGVVLDGEALNGYVTFVSMLNRPCVLSPETDSPVPSTMAVCPG